MKVTIKLNAYDMMKLADETTAEEIVAQAHNMVADIFDNKDNLMSATMSIDDKE